MYKHYKYFIKQPYPMQFACFRCRKEFKQIFYPWRTDKNSPLCPQCGERMWMMGRAFKAPKRSNIKQWHKVEALVRGGIKFHYNYFGRRIPKVLREVESFLNNIGVKSKG